MPSPETWSMLVTLAILVATVIMFAIGRIRTDLVALGAVLALTITGVLTATEAVSGFSNFVIFTTAGMFVISGAIVRTGLAKVISNKILGVAKSNSTVLFMLVMLVTALIGSLVSNTGTVAIMMPIVVSMALAIDESPSRFLMPLAFMSSIGGMFTLIGNSPNMVVAGVYASAGYTPLTLFSFLPVGAVCFLFGMLVVAPVASFFLSRRKNDKDTFRKKGLSMRELAEKYHLAQSMYSLTVPGQSPMVGKSLADLHLSEKYGVVVQEISRNDKTPGYFGIPHNKKQQIAPGPNTILMAGDTLRVLGPRSGVQSMVDEGQLELVGPENGAGGVGKFRFDSLGICEVVLMSSSRLVNRSVAESGLRDQFKITVLGIQRGDQYLLENTRDQVMQAGDALLVQGTWDNLARLADYSMNWVVVGKPPTVAKSDKMKRKIPFVATVIALMVISMALNIVPTVIAVLLSALMLVLGGCFTNMDEAYSAISWETLVMIACLLPMATAMEKTGIIHFISDHMVLVATRFGPHAALAVVYVVASLMNIVISTTPVALLVAPVALRIAVDLNYDPLPFLFAVATAASMCFASPFSTPSNALVMSAGRYTFLDYLKLGLPLQALMGVVMVFALPLLFPFTK